MMNKLFKATMVLLLMLNSLPLNFTWKGKSINLGLKEAEAGWVSGYTYRKKLTITGSTGAGTNYQVKLLIGESSGATGENFDLESHCSSFPNDIRFTDNDATTQLDYWVESTSGTTPNQLATVWIEVADDLGSNQDIYIYYGNPSAASASNGANTFMFFDDFSGAEQLTEVDTASDYITIDRTTDKKLEFNNIPRVVNVYASKTLTVPDNFSADVTWVISGDWAAAVYALGFSNSDAPIMTSGESIGLSSLGTSAIRMDSTRGISGEIAALPSGTTYYSTIKRLGNVFTLYVYSDSARTTQIGSPVSYTDTSTVSYNRIFAFSAFHNNPGYGTNATGWVDDTRVRKYASPEPSFSSAGGEALRERFILLD